MKTRNKVFIGSGVLFFILILAGYGFVSACGPWSDPDKGFRSRFCGGGFHTRFNSKDMADFFLWRMDKKANELNLTDAQKAKYETLKSNLKAHFSEGMDDRQRLREQFHEEMGKKNPDIQSLAESLKTKISELSGFANEHLDLLVDFYESLDSTQQRMITDEIKERMESHGASS